MAVAETMSLNQMIQVVADLYSVPPSTAAKTVAQAVAELNNKGIQTSQLDVLRSTLQSHGIEYIEDSAGVQYYTNPVSSVSGGLGGTVAANGDIVGYSVDWQSANYSYNVPTQATDLAQQYNSNLTFEVPQEKGLTIRTPVNTTVENGNTVFSTLKTGAGKALHFITGEVLPAVAATAVGIKLGKAIAPKLYDIAPDFWDALGISEDAFDPATWSSITTGIEDTWQGRIFNTIFGIDPDTDETTMYIDSDAIAAITKLLHDNGVLDQLDTNIIAGDAWAQSQSWYDNIQLPIVPSGTTFQYGNNLVRLRGADVCVARWRIGSSIGMLFLSKTTATFQYELFQNEGWVSWGGTIFPSIVTLNNQTFYMHSNTFTVNNPDTYSINESGTDAQIGYITLFGTPASISQIDGITDQPNATFLDFSTLPANPTQDDYKTLIQNTYPEMVTNSVTQTTVLPSGETQEKTYYPVPFPYTSTQTVPDPEDETKTKTYTQPYSVPDTATQTQPQITQQTIPVPKTAPQTQTVPLVNSSTAPPIDNPDSTGTGSSPEVVAVTGTATSLWAIYNPTQAEVNQFGAWLWSPDFVDQLLKLFNDPMQSIIGIHKIFATPQIGGTRTIVVGYLDSGVSSKYVSNQYTTIDCGTVKLAEKYQNVYDYSPFTQVSIYLPFIGIHNLDVGDIMRSSINVIYHVDVISGACLAEVKVMRDGNTAVLYQYSGNAAVTYPISSGSYMGMVSAVASIAGATIATIASGGSVLPLAMGAANAALNAHTTVQHSGSFSGNAGAMGAKKPYLIITRPQTAYADGIESLHGIGASSVLTVGECTGYIQATDADLTGISATDAELSELRSLLLSGIYV